jgi:hypothetical protein
MGKPGTSGDAHLAMFDQALNKIFSTPDPLLLLQGVGVWGTTMGKAGTSADAHLAMFDQALTQSLQEMNCSSAPEGRGADGVDAMA